MTTSVYRLDHRHVLRLFGIRMLVASGLVVIAVLCFALPSGVAQVIAYAVCLATVLMVVLAIITLLRPPAVLILTEQGYRVRRVRDCGVVRAPWLQVQRVEDARSPFGPVLVFTLEHGSTTLPLVLVASRSRELRHEVRERLNRANGYRPLS